MATYIQNYEVWLIEKIINNEIIFFLHFLLQSNKLNQQNFYQKYFSGCF